MKRFNYTAKNKQAEVVRDIIEADSRQKALSQLRKLHLTVVSLTEIEAIANAGLSAEGGANSPEVGAPKIPFWKKPLITVHSEKVKTSDMAVFCRQLAISVNSGLPLRDALAGIHEDMDSPAFKKILDHVLFASTTACLSPKPFPSIRRCFPPYLWVSFGLRKKRVRWAKP